MGPSYTSIGLEEELKAIARYAGHFLGPAEGFGQGFFFFFLWAFYGVFAHIREFGCLVVTLVTFSRNLNKEK